MSKAKPPARRPVVASDDDELDLPGSWRRRPWVPILVAVIVVATALGAGLAMDQALRTQPPTALSGCKTATQIAPYEFQGPPPICISPNRKYQATISTTQGTIVMDLYPQIAPVTVNNFIVLALNGYYNGLPWATQDWVVQSGDPIGNGRGGPGYTLPDEPNTTPSWDIGAVGMARPIGAPINGSQFFIERAAWPGTGPTAVYNRFGTVIQGMGFVQLLSSPTDRIISITIQVG